MKISYRINNRGQRKVYLPKVYSEVGNILTVIILCVITSRKLKRKARYFYLYVLGIMKCLELEKLRGRAEHQNNKGQRQKYEKDHYI